MNHIWTNQELNYLTQTNCQGREIHSSRSNNYHKLKPKAYINPQIVNYDHIKTSLIRSLASKKIHVNPNFKGNGFSNLQRTNSDLNTSVNPGVSDSKSQNNVIYQPGTSSVQFPSVGSSTFSSQTLPHRLATRYKKINNVSLKSVVTQSKFSWSKCDNSADKVNLIQARKKQNTPMNSDNSKVFLPTQNIYKYTAPKKSPKVVNTKVRNLLPGKNSSPAGVTKTKIINKSKTKLINTVSPKSKLVIKPMKPQTVIKRQAHLSRFTYNKYNKSSITRVATAVINKYKYTNQLLARNYKKTKYKIDKRKKPTEVSKKKSNVIQDIRKLFPNNVSGYKKAQFYNLVPSRNIHSWRKTDVTAKKTCDKRIDRFPNRRVVKIGGILYKSTVNKLMLARKKTEQDTVKKSVSHKKKAGRNHIVYVRGEKFILDKNGKTLRRQCQTKENSKVSSNTPRRIDIGGVTYIQKSQNVLIRTNVHKARFLVNKAKNKSIALLTNLYRRSAMPCMIYHKFGRCIRHTKGSCMYKHDPKNIAICKKFLKGECDDKNCLLSHEVIEEKMATCHFFLNGFCSRENCPFLHVKLNKNTSICKNFLQGFCNLGKNCSKRHCYQCPEFDKLGTCGLGAKCPYPHKVPDKVETSDQSSDKPKSKDEIVQYHVQSNRPCVKQKQRKVTRDLKQSKIKKTQKRGKKKKSLPLISDQSEDAIECFPKRIKLDKLPSYIPLKTEP